MVDRNQAQLMKRGAAIEKKIESVKASMAVPKWKAQSHQLRSMMKAARQPVTFGLPARGGKGGRAGGGSGY